MEAVKEETECRSEFLMDSGDLQEEGLHDFKEPSGSLDPVIGAELLKDCSALFTDSYTEHHGVDISGLVPDYSADVSPDEGGSSGSGGRNTQEHLLHTYCTTDGSIDQDNSGKTVVYLVHPEREHSLTDCYTAGPGSPRIPPAVGGTSCATSVVSGSPTFPGTSSHCADLGPVNAAAHLHLLGESLILIGQHLQESNKMVCLSRALSLLLDSLLCAMAPLMSLTSQVPELRSCTQDTTPSTLDNIAYLMPGL